VSALTLVKFWWVANIMENSFMKRVKIQSCHQSFCAFGIAYVKAVCKHISEIDPCWHNCWSIYLCKSSTPKLQIPLFIFPWHSLSYQSEQRTICWVENDFDLFKFFSNFFMTFFSFFEELIYLHLDLAWKWVRSLFTSNIFDIFEQLILSLLKLLVKPIIT